MMAAVYRGFDSRVRTPPLNLPAPGRRQTLYVVLRLRRALLFSKQSPPPTRAPAKACANTGPSSSKLRGQFAEFLQHHSLKRLGMLYQSTCVGLGYGL